MDAAAQVDRSRMWTRLYENAQSKPCRAAGPAIKPGDRCIAGSHGTGILLSIAAGRARVLVAGRVCSVPVVLLRPAGDA